MSSKSSQKSNRHKGSSMQQNLPTTKTLLGVMEDGEEYRSLFKYQPVDVNIVAEFQIAIKEVETIRKRPLMCYFGNTVRATKGSVSIDFSDDLPFSEMVGKISAGSTFIDVMVVTPGGLAPQVSKFVDRLRPRFEKVSYILPNVAMSAGTIWVLSGDEIIMDDRSYIGPIDPQVPGKDGHYLPAQAILTLLKEMQERGQKEIDKGKNPNWTDIVILKNLDPKELGNAANFSQYSIDLATDYLSLYKFKSWDTHKDGRSVTPEERRIRATEVATKLCNHGKWKSHGNGISRDLAWKECQIQIIHLESVPGLQRAVRRLWALGAYLFEIGSYSKMFASAEYMLIRGNKEG